jgi:Carboxypeptidase regulatory-like domain
MRRRILGGAPVVSLAAACLLASLAHAQARGARAAATTGTIDGVVSDTSLAPLSDAAVMIVGTEIRVVTSVNGRFRLVAVPAGQYVLLVRRIGFEATTAKINVAESDTLRVSFTLEPAVASLDPVKVAAKSLSPKLTEFYERRKVGPGQFMTQDEIEKQNPVRTTDLLRRFLGMSVSDGGAKSLRSPCTLTALVDGVTRYSKFNELPAPKEIAAIEFYAGPSEVPLQYKSMTTARCGLIMIWTRDGSS